MKSLKSLSTLLLLLVTIKSYSQEELGPHPVIFIDSVKVENLDNFDPNEVSSATKYTGKFATDKLGDSAKDGIVYFETKSFCRQRYWKYFKSKSDQYSKLLPTAESDTIVQYIINRRIQKGNFYGNLSIINDAIFKSIQIIDKETLIRDYGVLDKQYGAIIICDLPPNLLGGKDKF